MTAAAAVEVVVVAVGVVGKGIGLHLVGQQGDNQDIRMDLEDNHNGLPGSVDNTGGFEALGTEERFAGN